MLSHWRVSLTPFSLPCINPHKIIGQFDWGKEDKGKEDKDQMIGWLLGMGANITLMDPNDAEAYLDR